MNKKDIREYSDNELSLLVFNDEYLYLRRHKNGFLSELRKIFVFTDNQLDVLLQDLEDDKEE